MGIDPNKVAIVKSCLEASFKDVRQNHSKERFVFNDGQQTSELIFSIAVLDDMPVEQLKTYMKEQIIPKLKANPGMKIYVGQSGIEVSERDST